MSDSENTSLRFSLILPKGMTDTYLYIGLALLAQFPRNPM
jgi:hypothetical protein